MSARDQQPVFVDLYGTGARQGGPDGPDQMGGGGREPEDLGGDTLRRCFQGEERLWKVFWAYGFFGSGIVLAVSMGVIFFLGVFGLAVNPSQLESGIYGGGIGVVLACILIVPYVFWLSVSLWRCAFNCVNRMWGYAARGLVMTIVGGVLLSGYKIII